MLLAAESVPINYGHATGAIRIMKHGLMPATTVKHLVQEGQPGTLHSGPCPAILSSASLLALVRPLLQRQPPQQGDR